MNKHDVRTIIPSMLYAKHSCDAAAFPDGELVISELAPDRQCQPKHCSWPPLPIGQWRGVSVGQGGVVSATTDWLESTRAARNGKRRALDEAGGLHSSLLLTAKKPSYDDLPTIVSARRSANSR